MNAKTDPLSNPPSRLRSGMVNVALWGLIFGLIGLVIALVYVFGSGEAADAGPRGLMVLSLAIRFALFGVISGTLFWWVTGLLFDRHRFAGYGRIPVFLFGAIGTAVFVPLFMQAMNLLSGDGLVAWSLVLDDSVWAFFFGGVAALGSLEMARRWTPRRNA